jgi:hypothetical protein
MTMTFRRGGVIAVAILVGASLLHTSTPARAGLAQPGRNLNLRLSSSRALGPVLPPPGVWAAPVDRTTPQAIHAAAEASPPPPGLGATDGTRVVTLSVRISSRKPVRVMTNAPDVTDLMLAMGVRVNPADVLKPGSDSLLWQDGRVTLIRIRHVTQVVTVTIPFATAIRHSQTLPPGSSKVVTAGIAGSEERTYAVTYRNGAVVSRNLVSTRPISSPQDEVLLEGPAPATGSGVQFGEATWYSFCPVHGMYAAHKTLPYGTHVTVTNLDNGKSVTVVINDRGPYGPGRIVDLCPEAFSVIAPLGQGVARVRITW